MRRIAAALALASTLAAVACEFLNDASDLVGAPADASVESSADVAAETSAEAGARDAMDEMQIDGEAGAAADSGSDADACSGTYCSCLSPPPAFCDDFEEGNLARWVVQHGNIADAGTVSVSDAEAYSPPFAMLAVASTPVQGNNGDSVSLIHDLGDASFTQATLDFEVFIPALTPSDQIAGFAFNGYAEAILVSDGSIQIFEEDPTGNTDTTSFSTGTPPTGTWTPIELVFVPPAGGNPGSFTARIPLDDGGTAAGTYAIPADAAGGSCAIQIGADYIQNVPDGGWRAYFDNVTLRLQ